MKHCPYLLLFTHSFYFHSFIHSAAFIKFVNGIKYETLPGPCDTFVLSGSGSQPVTDKEVEMT